jgi:glycerol transport system ATP-binding protein
MLELRNVTKTVEGADHIRDVSLTLRNGTLNVLLGPTLSGKTSLMRLMAGLDRPTKGQVLVEGKDVPACRCRSATSRWSTSSSSTTRR